MNLQKMSKDCISGMMGTTIPHNYGFINDRTANMTLKSKNLGTIIQGSGNSTIDISSITNN